MKLISVLLILAIIGLSIQGRKTRKRKDIKFYELASTPNNVNVGAAAYFKCQGASRIGCRQAKHCEWIEDHCYDTHPMSMKGRLLNGKTLNAWCGTFPAKDCATICSVDEESNECSYPHADNFQMKREMRRRRR